MVLWGMCMGYASYPLATGDFAECQFAQPLNASFSLSHHLNFLVIFVILHPGL